MKQTLVGAFIGFVYGLLSPQVSTAQGTTTFVSNLGNATTGSMAVGSDSWLAADFSTGNNASGYMLNSIDVAMTDASGNPSGFTVMIYSALIGNGVFPGSNLGTLAGSTDPATGGIYTYTTPSDLALLPNSEYFIVLTAGTTVANGAYTWSVTGTPTTGFNSYHWGGEIFFAQSSDGLSWNYASGNYGQFALNATPVPEPGVIGLFALGGLVVGFCHWKARSV